ncbi:MAG: DUF2283 domain-containing protein [Caulobacteraceae bacterium]
MISTSYDAEADAMYVRIAPTGAEVSDTREIEPGVMLDLDSGGHLIGIEILGVRARSAKSAAAA